MQLTLKTLRELYGMRQYELAFKSNLSPTTISSIETGKKRKITFNCLKKISAAFGLKTSEVMGLFEIEQKGGTDEDIRKKFKELLEKKGHIKEIPETNIVRYKMAYTLKTIRNAERVNIYDLSFNLGIGSSILEAFENGYAKPGLKIIEKFAQHFNIDLIDLYKLFEIETLGVSYEEILESYLELNKQE